jgi:hypothetical protein
MLSPASAPSSAIGSDADPRGHRTRAALSLRALVVAALLSILLGGGLFEAFSAQHASVAPAVRLRASSHRTLFSLPTTLQGAVSTAIGADSRAYRVSASTGGFSAMSPAEHLRSTFTASGVSVTSGSAHIGLSLQAVGYGSALTKLGQVAPRAKADRVTYARAGVSEWYSNGPVGLEQGFTIPKAPAGHAVGPLTLSMSLSGNAHASMVSGGRGVTLSRAGKTVLRYTGLAATDARGHALHSWLQIEGGRLLLRVDARGARYPLRIDPFIQQGEKLIGSGQINGKEFGYSVALSGDGNTALIGGMYDNSAIGAAWVFTRSGSTWTQQGSKLTGSGEIGQGAFGSTVALSFDGNTALIGVPGDHASVGAAWVFTRSGSTWTQQGEKLTAKGLVAGNVFGSAIALSSDGNTALIGCGGVAWVFTRSGSTWTQQSEMLVGSERVSSVGPGGGSVALSSDGNTALIGFPIDNSTVGAAWVFTRSGSTWTQQGSKLTGSGEVGKGYFGWSVALSGDGNTALIGSTTNATWVFTRSGSTWTQQGEKLSFGGGVALSGDGNTALIGVWVFTRSGSTWTQREKLSFGGTALSSDGNTLLVGSPSDNESAGAALVFVNAPAAAPVNTGLPAISGLNGLPIGNTVGALQTMLCSTGIWTGNPIPSSFTYLWLRDGTGIGGATGSTYFVQEADRGYTLTCEVTASNSVGHQAATSLGVAYPAPPSAWVPPAGYSGGGYSGGGYSGGRYSGGGNTSGSGSVLGSTTASISTAQIAALLGQQLTPSGKAAKIAALLKSGGFTLSFKALEAGTAMIDWYEVPLGAKLAKAKAKSVLVAAGQRTFSAAGTAKITIKLTAAGKRLLKHAKQLKLTGKGTFTPTGKPHITTTKVFVLKH